MTLAQRAADYGRRHGRPFSGITPTEIQNYVQEFLCRAQQGRDDERFSSDPHLYWLVRASPDAYNAFVSQLQDKYTETMADTKTMATSGREYKDAWRKVAIFMDGHAAGVKLQGSVVKVENEEQLRAFLGIPSEAIDPAL